MSIGFSSFLLLYSFVYTIIVQVKFSHTRYRAWARTGADPGVQAVSPQVTF